MLRASFLLVLACAASAQDDGAILRATGETLADFAVSFDAAKVDRSSAEALAACFARLQREQHAVNARYVRLFRRAHLEVLRLYYARGLVEKQEASYSATAPRDDDVACEVKSVVSDKDGVAQALLDTTARSRETGKPETRRVLLQLRRAEDGAWRLLSIHDETPDKQWRERPLGVPPELRPRKPEPVMPSRASAGKALAELRDSVQVLGAAGHNGRLALQRHFFDILASFYGEAFAAEARARRPAQPAEPDTRVETGEGVQRPGDLVRIPVTVTEAVPGTKERSTIAEAAFDLKKGDGGGWRVVGELQRPHPDQPLQPLAENFALLFLVNG